MASKLFSTLNRLNSNILSNPKFSPFTNPISSRSLITLHRKISPIGKPATSVVPVLDKWVENGNEVKSTDLKHIIRDLRRRKRYTQALEVSEWMGNKGVCTFTSGVHAVQLNLIGRVHGVDSAESYFNNLNDEEKTEKTYGALLNCYVRERLTDKSLSHMQKMKDLGFASNSLLYNDLMSLYIKTKEYEKVPALLNEMKDNGITPNNFSYLMCIKSYGARADTIGVNKILEEMKSQSHIKMESNTYVVVANCYINAGLTGEAAAALRKAEQLMEKKDTMFYKHYISMYATLGNKAEMVRLWDLRKEVGKKPINGDYIAMLSSLVKLDDIEEAEKLLKEWESSGNSYDFRVPNCLLIGYSNKHLAEKAEAMLEDIVKKGKTPTPSSWSIIASGYMEKDEMCKSLRCMKMAFSLRRGRYEGWKPNTKVIDSLLRWLGDKGEVEEAEAFVELLKPVIPMNREMYHALIKASIRGGKEVDQLLEKMKADDIDKDEETKQILNLR